MGDNQRGRQLLKDLAQAVRAKNTPSGDAQLNQQGLAAIEGLARDLTGADAPPGLKLFRDGQERFRLQREKRNAEVGVGWEREIGAVVLTAERNGSRVRPIHYIYDQAQDAWRRMEGSGELYEDVTITLAEFLFPEARSDG